MKVRPMKSISVKLFFLTTFLVIITAGSLSFKSARELKAQLEENIKDRLLNYSEAIGLEVEDLFEKWDTNLRLKAKELVAIIGKSRTVDLEPNLKKSLERFLVEDESDHFVGVHFLKAESPSSIKMLSRVFTQKTASNNFKTQKAETIFTKLNKTIPAWLGEHAAKYEKKEIFISSFTTQTNLPLLGIARRIDIRGSETSYWLVLTSWQDPIVRALRKTSDASFNRFILGEGDYIISSANFLDMKKNRRYNELSILRAAKSSPMRHGYRDDYKDRFNREWVGSYYRIKNFGLTVLVQRETKIAYSEVNRVFKETLLFGAAFILIAIFFSFFGASGLTRNLKELTGLTQMIARGNFRVKLQPKSLDEVGLLTASVNMMSHQIQRLLVHQVNRVRMDKELQTAQAVQNTLFPKKPIEHNYLKVTGFSKPASECGGDWWGHYSNSEGVDYVVIADAMGHGVPAALVTAMAYSCCSTLATMIKVNSSEKISPKMILEKFNKVLYSASEGVISMTFFVLAIDYDKNEIIYANAGHNQPLLFPADPNDSRIKKKTKSMKTISEISPISLKSKGTILGVDENATFIEQRMPLVPGDKFFLFTDGLTECTNDKGEFWGRKTMIKKVLSHAHKDIEELKNGVLREAFRFFNNHPLDDDLTVVIVEYPKINENVNESSNKNEAMNEDITPSIEGVDGKENQLLKGSDQLGIDDHQQSIKEAASDKNPAVSHSSSLARPINDPVEEKESLETAVPPPPSSPVDLFSDPVEEKQLSKKPLETAVPPPPSSSPVDLFSDPVEEKQLSKKPLETACLLLHHHRRLISLAIRSRKNNYPRST